jgi:PAS domain-containing protein
MMNSPKSPVEPIDEVHLAKRYDFSLPRIRSAPPPHTDPLVALMSAFRALTRRGVGPHAFGATFADSPLAFLLDSIQDGVLIRRSDGSVMYRNRAAETLSPAAGNETLTRYTEGGVTYERRQMRYLEGDRQVIIEVVSRRG